MDIVRTHFLHAGSSTTAVLSAIPESMRYTLSEPNNNWLKFTDSRPSLLRLLCSWKDSGNSQLLYKTRGATVHEGHAL